MESEPPSKKVKNFFLVFGEHQSVENGKRKIKKSQSQKSFIFLCRKTFICKKKSKYLSPAINSTCSQIKRTNLNIKSTLFHYLPSTGTAI